MPVIVNGRTDGEWEISPDYATGGVVMTLVQRGRRHTATLTAEEMPLAEQVLAEVPESGSTDLTAAFLAKLGRDPFGPPTVEPGWAGDALGLVGGLTLALSTVTPWEWLRIAGGALAVYCAACLAGHAWRRLRRPVAGSPPPT